jgi:DedD protein
MEEKQQLNDIILNKGDSINNNKKIVLAVATLGVVLIIVVLLMNSISSSGTDNLPQAVLPPEPKSVKQETKSEPLFEEVQVVQENNTNNNLDNIAQRLKEESKQEIVEIPDPVVEKAPIVEEKPKVVQKIKSESVSAKSTSEKMYYAQVGSFSKFEPNKKFLKSITDKGFNYTYKKVGTLNKVLIGPFNDEKEARESLKVIKGSIEPAAFLVRY